MVHIGYHHGVPEVTSGITAEKCPLALLAEVDVLAIPDNILKLHLEAVQDVDMI